MCACMTPYGHPFAELSRSERQTVDSETYVMQQTVLEVIGSYLKRNGKLACA